MFSPLMPVERHLILQEITLHPSGEWTLPAHGWTVARIAAGVGYWLQGGDARELKAGETIVSTGGDNFVIRASSLNTLKLEFFFVLPQFLNGLLTVTEGHQLEQAGRTAATRIFLFSAQEPVSQKFARLVALSERDTLPVRSALLQLWAQAIAGMLSVPLAAAPGQDLRTRFRQLVGQMPDAELATRSLPELAEQLHCSERHFSRLFREQFGVPLRSRQTELRLQHARQLLVDVNAKIINVAYESGYRHLGLFNAMFKKRFGVTPSEWRQQNLAPQPKKIFKRPVAAIAWILAVLLQLLFVPASPAISEDTAGQAEARSALRNKMLELRDLPVSAKNKNRPSDIALVTLKEAPARVKKNPATNGTPAFKVEKYLVAGNTVIRPGEFSQMFTNVPDAFGTNVTFADIREALGELQMAYRERGFVTVAVSLPPQKLTNDTVQIKVTEGQLATINVKGNQYFSTKNVLRALPSLHTNMLLNSHVFQRELDLANANRDRQIYPVIGPGVEPGTSELTLKVKDRFPVHGRAELNNSGTPGTPDNRISINAQYGNLWQLEHQLGIQYGFSPLDYSDSKNFYFSPLDEPTIANYSAYYRMPLGGMQSVQQQIDSSNGRFGYNEVTHQFQMPAPSGRPELTLFASRSRSDTGVQPGTPSTVVSTPLLTIVSQDSGQNITLNEGLGGKISIPLPAWKKLNSSISFGLDFKRYQQVSFNTNSFFATTYITNSDGSVNPISSTVNSPQPPHDSGVDYFPMNAGFNGSVADAWGTTFFNAQVNWNLASVGKLSSVAYTTNAPDNYFTVQAGASREQRIYKDWTLLLRADGQWARDPLFSNEQYGMGGTAGVRGYSEGEAYGDSGWRVMVEPRTPLVNIGMIDAGYGDIPFYLRASAFLDYGELYRVGKLPAGFASSSRYCGTGCALTANIGSHLDARVTVAWPLIRHANASEGMHVYFGVGAQF